RRCAMGWPCLAWSSRPSASTRRAEPHPSLTRPRRRVHAARGTLPGTPREGNPAMSDPTMRERPAPPVQTDDTAPARRRSPLPWILLLLVIALAAWYFISRGDTPADSAPAIGETTPLPSESPVSTPPATRERPAPERTRPAVPADRVAAPIDQPAPEYPAAALRAGEQGTVVLRVDVGADGKPTDVQVAEGSRSRE